jgi:transposase
LALIRRYGRATPGQRVVDHVPDNYGTNQTMIAAVSLDGRDAPWVVDGAIKGAIFHCWVSEVLEPTLQPGDIVLWDNLSAHQVAGVADLLATRGARLLRLSPYSPDFNPIEQCWATIKTCLRRAKARTVEALIEAIKEALDTVTQRTSRSRLYKLLNLLRISFSDHIGLKNNKNRINRFQRGAECASDDAANGIRIAAKLH